MRQFDLEDGRLQFIKSAVEPKFAVVVFDSSAVTTKHLHAFAHFVVVGNKHAAIAKAAEILAGEEAVTASVTDSSNRHAFVTCPHRLSAIFNHVEVVFFSNFQQSLHFAGLPEQPAEYL